MKDKPSDELVKIIGEDRTKYSDDEVKEAETELKKRSSDEELEFKNRMKRYGGIVAFIGGVMFLWALILIPMSIGTFSGAPIPDENAPFLMRNFHIMFYIGGTLQIVIGGILLIGGLAFRSFKEWGRKIILFVLCIGIVYLIGFIIFWEISLISMAGLSSHTIVMAIGGIIILSLFFLIFLIPLKYFRSRRVREICV